jgi:hypothetical protein
VTKDFYIEIVNLLLKRNTQTSARILRHTYWSIAASVAFNAPTTAKQIIGVTI